MLAMASREEVSGGSEPGTVLQKVSQETLGRKNATFGLNEVNLNRGERERHTSAVAVQSRPAKTPTT
jgi:hypothetical protein